MKWIKPLCNIVIPAGLFYAAYHIAGIVPAIMISLVHGVLSVIHAKNKGHQVKNSQIIGFLGLVGSAAAILCTGEEKLYYVPSIIKNVIFLGFMIVLSVRRKSVLHYFARDFDIQSLEQIPEEQMFRINAIWMAYFLLKIISKVFGILYLNFRELYWVVFLLGDPMTILVVILSIVFIRHHCAK